MTKPLMPTDAEGLFQTLLVVARDRRTTLLVDCLCDLREEMLFVIEELDKLDFDTFDFLALMDHDDIDDDDRDPGVLH